MGSHRLPTRPIRLRWLPNRSLICNTSNNIITGEGRGQARTGNEPYGDFIHDIGDARQEEENAGNQIEVVHNPQLRTCTESRQHGTS